MGALKKLASDSAIYGLNSILGRSVNFLLVAVHSAVFLPAQMGIIITIFTCIAVLNVVYTFGMETTFFRFATKDKENFNNHYNQAQSSLLVSSLVFSGIIILFAPIIAAWMGHEDKSEYVIWMALILALDNIVAIPFAKLRLQNKAKKYVAIRLGSVFLNVLLNVFFLVFCKKIQEGELFPSLQGSFGKLYSPALGVGYIILANLMANLIYIPLLWKELVTQFSFRWHKASFKAMWQYSYPLLILGLAGILNQTFDRLMLKNLLPINFYPGQSSETVLGIYGNCIKLAVLINLATQSFRFAADPFFFSKAADKNAPELFAKVALWFNTFCCVLLLVITLNLDIIGPLFLKNPAYHSGFVVVPLVLWGNLFLALYYNVAVWFKLKDKTIYGTYITIFGMVVNIGLNLILIPKMGYMGCGWAFVASSLCMVLACYCLGLKHFPIPYPVIKMGLIIAVTIFCTWVNQFIPKENLLITLGIRVLLFMAYIMFVLGIEKIKHLAIKPYKSPN